MMISSLFFHSLIKDDRTSNEGFLDSCLFQTGKQINLIKMNLGIEF